MALASFRSSFGERGNGWTTCSLPESNEERHSVSSCSTPMSPAEAAAAPLWPDGDVLRSMSVYRERERVDCKCQFPVYVALWSFRLNLLMHVNEPVLDTANIVFEEQTSFSGLHR